MKCDVDRDVFACEVGGLPRGLYHAFNHSGSRPAHRRAMAKPPFFYECRLMFALRRPIVEDGGACPSRCLMAVKDF